MPLRYTLGVIFLVFSASLMAQNPPVVYQDHLLPMPAHIGFQPGRMIVDSGFTVSVDAPADPRLTASIQRFISRLENVTAIQLSHDLKNDPSAHLIIRAKSPGHAIPQLDDDESYTLAVSGDQAILTANQTVGAMRGLETFLQLLDSDKTGFFVPLATVDDKPRFPWRGLLIDVGRHFEPVDVIKRELDGLAAVKMNVFHWHLSDDQGFRVESSKFPKLQQMGSDGLYYTQEQVKDVVAFAAARGIRVVPEFDMPGHATSWFVGYPELASAPGPYQIERKFGIFDPTFNPADERVYKFLDTFFGEMSQLFPDEYIHIGGDESNGKQWNANPKIQVFMKKKGLKDNGALQAYFNQRLQKILTKHGKKMVGWDEILHPDLPKDIVVQSWRGEKSLNAGAKMGYRGILSAPYYLDRQDTAAVHYKADPIPEGTDLTAEQQSLILGGEACMWSEHINPGSIDSRIWPRLAAIAERLWSPRSMQDAADMYRRLDYVSLELEGLGLQHELHRDQYLRQILGERDVATFNVFAGILSPASLGQRARAQHTTQLTPLTRLVDAVAADPPAARKLQVLVDGLLADKPNYERNRTELMQAFAAWRLATPAVVQMVDSHPQLQEVAPRAAELDGLGQLGQEALNYLRTGVQPSQEWVADSTRKLDEAARPKGLVKYAVAESLRKLVQAAATPNSTSPKVSGN
jgi:hexosaminidase